MARVSMNEVKVGLLVILAILLVVTLSASLSNLGSMFSDQLTLRISIESSNGLEEYAKVTYRGVPVGAITRVYYDNEEETPILEAQVDANSGISTDSDVIVTSAGLLSPLYIEIREGDPEKRLSRLIEEGQLDPDEPVYLEAQPYASIGEFFALAGDVKSALGKVESLLDSAREPIGKVSGLISSVSRELKVVLIDVKELMSATRPRVISFLDDTSGLVRNASEEFIPTLKNIRTGSNDIPELLTSMRSRLESILEQADDMMTEVRPEVVETIREFRGNLQVLQGRVANIEAGLTEALGTANTLLSDNQNDINKMVDHLKRASIYLDDLSRQLASDPWRAVWKSDGRREPARVSPEWKPDDIQSN